MYIYIYAKYTDIKARAMFLYFHFENTQREKLLKTWERNRWVLWTWAIAYNVQEEFIGIIIITDRSYSPIQEIKYEKIYEDDTVWLSPSVENIVILCAFLEGFQVTVSTHVIRIPVTHTSEAGGKRIIRSIVQYSNKTSMIIYDKTNKWFSNSVIVLIIYLYMKHKRYFIKYIGKVMCIL